MRNHKTRIERFIDNSPLKITHYKIWLLSALGVFMDGLDLFIIAVALPLIDVQFHPNKWELGLIGAASPIGAIFGAMMLGYLTDKIGRKKLYVGSMALFVLFSFLSAAAWSINALILFRFLLGIGIGADYPISSTYLSEFMPKKLRSRAIISAFSFQALGALSGAALGLVTLIVYPEPTAWRWMLGLTIIPAFIIGLMRTQLPESALWLQSKNQHKKAAEVVAKVIGKSHGHEKTVSLMVSDKVIHHKEFQKKAFYYELFTPRYLRQTLLTSVPWFIMDICLYGVGVFSAMILASVFAAHPVAGQQTTQTYISSSIRAITGSVFLDIFLVIGFISAVFAIKKLGTIRLQNIGFFGMTIGLLILGIGTYHGQNPIFVFVGFAIFNLMVNFGPNPTTYMLPTERFPPYIRASGHGFAASAGKVGAAIGIFFLPVFIKSIGISLSMFLLSGCSMLGLIFTAFLGRKTSPPPNIPDTQPTTKFNIRLGT
jgi:MFS family permease